MSKTRRIEMKIEKDIAAGSHLAIVLLLKTLSYMN